MTKPMTLEAKFWKRVEQSDGCWLWNGNRTRAGYGVISLGQRGLKMYAHRFSWELVNGPIPEGFCACHRCDTPGCVRPDHLFVGTHAENMADMAAKGRAFATRNPDRVARGEHHGSVTHPEALRRGSRHGLARLTEPQIVEIRQLRSGGLTLEAIADRFHVTASNICSICLGHTWRHVLEASA